MTESNSKPPASLTYEDKILYTSYRNDLIIKLMQLMGATPIGHGSNKPLPVDEKILTFRANTELQLKMLNEIYYLSRLVDEWDMVYYHTKINK